MNSHSESVTPGRPAMLASLLDGAGRCCCPGCSVPWHRQQGKLPYTFPLLTRVSLKKYYRKGKAVWTKSDSMCYSIRLMLPYSPRNNSCFLHVLCTSVSQARSYNSSNFFFFKKIKKKKKPVLVPIVLNLNMSQETTRVFSVRREHVLFGDTKALLFYLSVSHCSLKSSEEGKGLQNAG